MNIISSSPLFKAWGYLGDKLRQYTLINLLVLGAFDELELFWTIIIGNVCPD
jgi:hypothetical protein